MRFSPSSPLRHLTFTRPSCVWPPASSRPQVPRASQASHSRVVPADYQLLHHQAGCQAFLMLPLYQVRPGRGLEIRKGKREGAGTDPVWLNRVFPWGGGSPGSLSQLAQLSAATAGRPGIWVNTERDRTETSVPRGRKSYPERLPPPTATAGWERKVA